MKKPKSMEWDQIFKKEDIRALFHQLEQLTQEDVLVIFGKYS